jgi:hypothetical protein
MSRELGVVMNFSGIAEKKILFFNDLIPHRFARETFVRTPRLPDANPGQRNWRKRSVCNG